jgi:hypothetical protein
VLQRPLSRAAAVGASVSVLVLAVLLPARVASLAAPLPQLRRPVLIDPLQLPRLGLDDLRYVGAFRLPAVEREGDSFSFAGGPLAFNGDQQTLFVGARQGKVAEITVPTPVNSPDINALPFAELVQPFADPSDGRLKEIGEGATLGGLFVYQQRLYGSGFIFYDAGNTQSVSHFARPLVLSRPGATPFKRIGEQGRLGFVAGYMSAVPPEWQARLGAPAVTGQCCVPIISRTSWGPSAFAWNPAEFDRGNAVRAIPLMFYDANNPTLGAYEGSSQTFGGTTQIGGVALIDRTRTALFVGGNGTGPFCYGNGTPDKSLAGKAAADGTKYCYDPANTDKGQHAFPYQYQVWAFDLADWAAVKDGRKDPWEVRPYGVWRLELPIAEPSTRISGVTFDPQRRWLFIAQRAADRDGYAFRALIHVYEVGAGDRR